MKIFRCIFVFFTVGIMSACSKPEQYSEIPDIEFDRVELRDTLEKVGSTYDTVKLVKLVFKIIDGDGNIGLQPDEDDILFQYKDSLWNNNFFSERFTIIGGVKIFINDSLAPPYYRIPYVQPLGQNKTLKAEININITYPYYSDGLQYDTVVYDFFVVDRALNKSNLQTTPKIPLNDYGIIR